MSSLILYAIDVNLTPATLANLATVLAPFDPGPIRLTSQLRLDSVFPQCGSNTWPMSLKLRTFQCRQIETMSSRFRIREALRLKPKLGKSQQPNNAVSPRPTRTSSPVLDGTVIRFDSPPLCPFDFISSLA
jgi:hypothetical protein